MIRVAVLGVGRIGAIHLRNVEKSSRAEVARVVHRDDDPYAAIQAGDVDAVVVCTPTPTHCDLIEACVAAGKPVLCEKPVALDLARARRCLERVGTAAPVMIAFNRRFDPSFAEAYERVVRGEIGALEQLTIVSRDPRPPSAAYAASSGGLFVDMMIHDLDMARHFCGSIVEVHAVGQNVVDPAIGAAGDVDAAVVVLKAASGAVATIVDNRRCVLGYDQRLEAFGSAGAVTVGNVRATTTAVSGAGTTAARGPYLDFFLERYAASYVRELDAFLDAVERGGPMPVTLADGVAALELAEECRRQVRQAGPHRGAGEP